MLESIIFAFVLLFYFMVAAIVVLGVMYAVSPSFREEVQRDFRGDTRSNTPHHR